MTVVHNFPVSHGHAFIQLFIAFYCIDFQECGTQISWPRRPKRRLMLSRTHLVSLLNFTNIRLKSVISTESCYFCFFPLFQRRVFCCTVYDSDYIFHISILLVLDQPKAKKAKSVFNPIEEAVVPTIVKPWEAGQAGRVQDKTELDGSCTFSDESDTNFPRVYPFGTPDIPGEIYQIQNYLFCVI